MKKTVANLVHSIKARAENITVASFMIPMLMLLTTFSIIPTLQAIWFSFTNQALVGEHALNPQFIGLGNFEALVMDPAFYQSVIVTFEYAILSFIGRFFIGLVMALLLNAKGIKIKGLMAGIALLPWMIPGVVHAFVWTSLLDIRYGSLNRFLSIVGLSPQRWLYDRAMVSIVLVNVWSGMALSTLLLTSAIASIPSEYYDAAEVCGASSWFKFKHVTLPLIKYPLILTVILIVKEDIDDFTYAFVLTEGGPRYRTELLSLYSYHSAFKYYELGYGCAASMILVLIIFVLGFMQLKLSRAR